ncbi:MAG: hypothetical protein LV481_10320 [Methylacidiphilales bacterium]|nr:hypothetical protein [Candidatus Methylacidiphilales bacterium]
MAATCIRADDDDKPAMPLHDPDINSPTYDGSTFVTDPSKKPTADEIRADQEAQQEQSTWLIRSYEQRAKMESVAKGDADPLDPFTRISSNKDLAKLAGLTTTTSSSPTDITSLHATTDPTKDGPTLRLDPSQVSSQQKFQPVSGGSFKWLITPLSAPDTAGLPDFYATLPAGTPAPMSVLADTSTPVAVPPAPDTPPVTEMPGLTAAKSHFTLGKLNYDLTLEPLPDDFHNKQADDSGDKNNNVLPQAPSGDTAKQLQHMVQVVTTGKTTPQPAPLKVVILPDPDLTTPKPIAVPIIMGGRPQIQDPNDFIR